MATVVTAGDGCSALSLLDPWSGYGAFARAWAEAWGQATVTLCWAPSKIVEVLCRRATGAPSVTRSIAHQKPRRLTNLPVAWAPLVGAAPASAGVYFITLPTFSSFTRPAIVQVAPEGITLLRRAETIEDLVRYDENGAVA
jgi:hypothetical protein